MEKGRIACTWIVEDAHRQRAGQGKGVRRSWTNFHSDQGWQYQHKHYQKMLKDKGIRQSMRRKGNCLDNAVMENFFGLLKTELLYIQNFDLLAQFHTELEEYMDYYNNRRIKLKRNGLTPAQHRSQAIVAA